MPQAPYNPVVRFDHADLYIDWIDTDIESNVIIGLFDMGSITDQPGAIPDAPYAGTQDTTAASWSTTIGNRAAGPQSYTLARAAWSNLVAGNRYGIRIGYETFVDGSQPYVWPHPNVVSQTTTDTGMTATYVRNATPGAPILYGLGLTIGAGPTYQFTWGSGSSPVYNGWAEVPSELEITASGAPGTIVLSKGGTPGTTPGSYNDNILISRSANVSQSTTTTFMTATALSKAPANGNYTLTLVVSESGTLKWTWGTTDSATYNAWIDVPATLIIDDSSGGSKGRITLSKTGGPPSQGTHQDTIVVSQPVQIIQEGRNTGVEASGLTSPPAVGAYWATLDVASGPTYKWTWGDTSSSVYNSWGDVPATFQIASGNQGTLSLIKASTAPTTTVGTYQDKLRVDSW